jgi:hypothetical protein
MHRLNKQTEINNEEREGQEETTAQISQIKGTEDETVQHAETQVEEQTPSHDKGEMEEQEGFEEAIYGWNHRRQ